MNWATAIKTIPSVEPVSVDEVKGHLRYGDDDENVWLKMAIKTARRLVESYTNRQLCTATWNLYLDAWPAGPIRPPFPPLSSTSFSIKYYDTAGVQQTWGAANYAVDVAMEPGRVGLAPNASYPSIQDRQQAIDVEYVAGYGAAAAVPEEIRMAVLMLVADTFAHRGSQAEMRLAPNQQFWDLLGPFRVTRFADNE